MVGSPSFPTRQQIGYNVFLSHAAENDELAVRIMGLLNESDISVFATRAGFPGGIWSDEVRAALEESEHFWLLLTDQALTRSVYVHHEFGYFYGYHRQKDGSLDARNVGRLLRYIFQDTDGRRPGMYQHFQGFPVTDFSDPVEIARIIANDIGREFTEPKNPESLKLYQNELSVSPPDSLDEMRITRARAGSQRRTNQSESLG